MKSFAVGIATAMVMLSTSPLVAGASSAPKSTTATIRGKK